MLKTKHTFLLFFSLWTVIACNTSDEKTPELILAADREAPIGWVNFNAYADSTFKYSLSRNSVYNGTYSLKGDTLFLSFEDKSVGIDKVVINNGALAFFGKASPGFANISVNKITSHSMETKTVNDSICTYNEIVGDLKKHYTNLANSISKSNYNFQTIAEVFKYHTSDTNLKFKSENILILRFDDYNGLEMHIKGLSKLKHFSFDSLKVDRIELIKFYPGVLPVQDDIISEDTLE